MNRSQCYPYPSYFERNHSRCTRRSTSWALREGYREAAKLASGTSSCMLEPES